LDERNLLDGNGALIFFIQGTTKGFKSGDNGLPRILR
jgi:hypothetical protein